jgi:hypothetical protein
MAQLNDNLASVPMDPVSDLFEHWDVSIVVNGGIQYGTAPRIVYRGCLDGNQPRTTPGSRSIEINGQIRHKTLVGIIVVEGGHDNSILELHGSNFERF